MLKRASELKELGLHVQEAAIRWPVITRIAGVLGHTPSSLGRMAPCPRSAVACEPAGLSQVNSSLAPSGALWLKWAWQYQILQFVHPQLCNAYVNAAGIQHNKHVRYTLPPTGASRKQIDHEMTCIHAARS